MDYQFEELTQRYLSIVRRQKLDEKRIRSRSDLKRPFLVYRPIGNYGYIQNYEAVCTYSNRSVEDLVKFLTHYMGCKVEYNSQHLRTQGVVKRTHFKHVQNLYYSEQVLCMYCRSPETTREGSQIACVQCGRTYKQQLGKLRSK